MAAPLRSVLTFVNTRNPVPLSRFLVASRVGIWSLFLCAIDATSVWANVGESPDSGEATSTPAIAYLIGVIVASMITAVSWAGVSVVFWRWRPLPVVLGTAGGIAILATALIAHQQLGKSESWYLLLVAILGGACGELVSRQASLVQERAEQNAIRISLGRIQIPVDRRMAIAGGAYLAAIGITPFFAILAASAPETSSWPEFYAAWTEDLLFFLLVGFVIAALSLSRPEDQLFEYRVQTLFSGKSGPAVDFVRDSVRKLGYCASRSERTMTITDFDVDRRAYRVEFKMVRSLRNLFDDTEARDESEIGISPDKFANAPNPLGLVTSIKIEGEDDKVSGPTIIPETGFRKSIQLTIPEKGDRKITVEYWMWCALDSPQYHTPTRFTEVFEATIKNLWFEQNRVPAIEMVAEDGRARSHPIPYNRMITIAQLRSVAAGRKVCEFRFLAPIDNRN